MRNFSPSEHTFDSGMDDETVLLHLERGMRKQGPDGLSHARANCLPITRLQRTASLGCFASPALEGLKHVALGTRSSVLRSGGLPARSARTHVSLAGCTEDCVLRHPVYATVSSSIILGFGGNALC